MTLDDEGAQHLAELSGLLIAEDLSEALSRVSRVAARSIAACERATVTMWRDGRPATVGYSEQEAAALDELQYVEAEGPCIDAVREGSVMRVRDLADEPRWPSYAPRAAAAGVRSSVTLPLAAHGQVVGALNLYSEQPDAFRSEDVALGELLAAHAGLAVHGATLYFASRDLADQLNEAMASRAVIEQAKGIVMARDSVTADEAFDVLRQRSQASNRKLRDVAGDLVQSVVQEEQAG